jgi:hypothetical protein
MYLINMWGPRDEELLVDMSVKRPEVQPDSSAYFRAWMQERIRWGRPFLFVAGAITLISIITMVIKHI